MSPRSDRADEPLWHLADSSLVAGVMDLPSEADLGALTTGDVVVCLARADRLMWAVRLRLVGIRLGGVWISQPTGPVKDLALGTADLVDVESRHILAIVKAPRGGGNDATQPTR